MTSKSFAKLLSVILTLAICATTVFGCLMTANAQDVPSYVVSEQKLVKGTTGGQLDTTFTITSGMAVGFFTVDNQNNWYTAVTATIKSATPVEGTFDADDFVIEVSKEASDATVSFETVDEKLYSTVVLTLDFTFTNAIENDIEVKLSNLDFSDLYDNYSNFNAKNGKFIAGCTHEYTVSGTPVYTDDANAYAVYNSAVCSLCGESKGGYQVKPVVAAPVVSVYSDAAKATTMSGSGTENDPYIVETADQFAAMARGYIVTDGKYFKVADGVDAFVLNGGAEIMNMTTAEQVRDYFRANGGNIWWMPNSKSVSEFFRGHFDGNGVTIYGLYTGSTAKGNVQDRAALFPKVAGSVTIKNINLKNSYVESTMHAAGIVAQGSEAGLITIENCSVEDCYIRSNRQNSDHRSYGGVLLASTVQTLHAYNCSVVDNIATYIYDETELMPVISASANSSTVNGTTYKSDVKNIIVIGSSVCGQGWSLFCISDGQFKNVYTDSDLADLKAKNSGNTDTNLAKYNVRSIAKEDLYGAKAMQTIKSLADSASATGTDNFDWNTESNPNGIWYVGKAGDYPTLLKGYELSAANNTAAEWNLLGANIEYKNDGSYALNFHFTPAYENQDIELYVAKADTKNGFVKLNTYTTSPFANEFVNAKMFAIDTLSARDIDTTWLATIITKAADGGEIVYGKTESISIADVANAVVNGDAYYNSAATAEQKANDVKVAAALINYNDAVKNISNEAPAPVVDAWDGTVDSNLTGDGTAQSPFIIDSAEKLAYIAINAGFEKTNGNYYKVADGISAFNMNTTGKDLSGDLTAQQVKSKLENEKVNSVWWSNKYFAGHFDGNGVTIYGLHSGNVIYKDGVSYTNQAGLFPMVDGNATIKNVTVKNSYFEGGYAGSVVGKAYQTNDSTYTITLENVASVSNYVVCTSTEKAFGGIVFAYAQKNYLHVNGCLAANNVGVYSTTSITAEMPVISYANNGTSNIQNLISIGSSVHGNTWNFNRFDSGTVKNVYTDHSFDSLETLDSKRNTATNRAKYNIVQLDTADLLGVAAMKNITTFDWENVWTYGAEGKPPVLAPRTNESTEKKAVYWVANTYDDDFIVHEDQPGDGTKENPYIIFDAEDLASTVAARVVKTLGATKDNATAIDTTGVYFKVADSIGAFYMANDDPTYGSPDKWDTMEKVKAALSNKAGVYKWWSINNFNGNFDGNGATVYGLFADKERAALFHKVGTTATIKNITLANSYLSAPTNGFAGGIIGSTSTNSGSIVIENCGIINNYIHSAYNGNTYYGGAGAIVGNNYWGPAITINNCMVIGNDVANDYASTLTTPGLIGFAAKGTVSNTVVIGSNPYIISDSTSGQFNTLKASANAANYTNVYTDANISEAEALYGIDYADNQLKQLTVAQMQGAAAEENMQGLAWGSVWFAGRNGEYPSFTKPSTMPNDMQAAYDSLALDNHDNYGDSTAEFGVYSTALTLKTNPYISFTFAFNGEYKQNSDVVVTFTAGSYTKTVTAADMTNNEGAGRYHLYRLKDAPVKALCDGITVTASYGGKTYNLGTYSVEGFALAAYNANIKEPSGYYMSRYEAAKALLFYSQMLKNRYGA